LATAPFLQQKLTEAIHPQPSHLVLDCTEVGFLGSAGLENPRRHQRRSTGRWLPLGPRRGGQRRARTALHVTELSQILDLHTELGPAVAACRANPMARRHGQQQHP
jgi:hypothetical protein